MATLSGSPGKAGLINSRMQEYMKNLNKDSQPVLKQISPSKMNSNSNLNGILEGKKPSPMSSPSRFMGKENSPTKPLQFKTSDKDVVSHHSSPFLSPSSSKLSPKDRDYQEFLIRVEEAKRWIEAIIEESLPSAIDMATTKCMSDGVYLAQLVAKVKPELVKKIIPPGNKLMYAHTQNINAFLDLVDYVNVPDLFRFELNDLYDRKNIPKVFETIHATASILGTQYGSVIPPMQNLSGQVNISMEDVKTCQRKLPGVRAFRSFNEFTSRPSSPKKSSPQKGLLDSAVPLTPTKPSKPQKSIEIQEPIELKSPPKTPNRYPSAIVHDIQDFSLKDIETKTPHLSYDSLSSPQRLTYSPDRTFSYYSPGVSRQLSYRTEDIGYFNRRRHQWDYDFDYYDTYRYSSSQYSPKRKERMTEVEFLDTLTHLQAVLRGLNTRYDIHLKKLTLKHKATNFPEFQAHCKAVAVRKAFETLKTKYQPDESLPGLQAILRGTVIRNELYQFRLRIIKKEQLLWKLRSHLRGVAQRKLTKNKLQYREAHGNNITSLQAIIRAIIKRREVTAYSSFVNRHSKEVIKLQAISRGKVMRLNMIQAQGSTLQIQLQALLRAVVQRNKIKTYAAVRESTGFQRFGPILKGYLVSNRYTVAPTKVTNEVVTFNAIIKGMLTRFAMELLIDIVENNGAYEFQANVRGYLVRKHLADKMNFYEQNKKAVILIQKNIKRYQVERAYKELISATCPSLSSVRRFVHILNQSDTEVFSMQLQKLKSKINDINEEIGEVESSLQQKTLQKDCLESRGIDVSKFLTIAGRQQLELHFQSVNTEGVSKKLQSVYGKVGFLLQVDSYYWKMLSKKDPNFCLSNIPKIYAPIRGNINERENSLYVKVIGDLMSEDIDESPTLDAFLTEENSFWGKALQEYLINFRNKEVQLAFSQLYKYLDSEMVDFESDPSILYSKLHPSQPPQSPQFAIEDPQTNSQFIKNMTSLWAAVDMTCAIIQNLSSTRNELRYLATKVCRLAANKDSHEKSTLQAISKLLIDIVASTVLLQRENFGSVAPGPGYYKKAQILLDTLNVAFGFREFEGYFSPLNQYSTHSEDQFTETLKGLLVDPEEVNEYETIVYRDMADSVKPTMMVYHQTFIKIIEKLRSVKEELPHDDPMVLLLDEIRQEFDKTSVNGHTQLTINLDPSVFKVTLNNGRTDLIYKEAKQGICYLMQVEEVNTNLTDLLVSEILPEDEIAFESLLAENPNIANTLSDDTGTISYTEFKKSLLYRVKELAALGILQKENNYQFILVDIANTIKTRPRIEELNCKEMKLMTAVYNALTEKQRNLILLVDALDKATRKAIEAIQAQRSYTPLKKSGLGNKLKDAYHKTQKKNTDSNSGISYKWSSKQLFDQGILVRTSGSSLQSSSVNFFGSTGPKAPAIDFKISTTDGEVFGIEMIDIKNRTLDMHAVVRFTDLIAKESIDSKATISLFEKKNKTVMRVSKLLDLLVHSFFR